MQIQAPSPQTSLVILLGASTWPHSPEFQDSEAFANAARRVKAYFLNPRPFGLPSENLLDLFNADNSDDELDMAIGQFLKLRLAAMKADGHPATDLLLYFIGHGGFVGRDSDFYLAIRRTRMDNPRASGLQMMSLADTLTEQARSLRRIIILDCCFAAAAFSAFQSGPAHIAMMKTIDAFETRQKATGFPTKGTTLLCSSNHKSPSLLLPDGSSTMFTKAFLDALVYGTQSRRDRLTLRDVRDKATDLLSAISNAPKPVLHSPDQSEGDVADIPFFPNPRVEKAVTTKSGPSSGASMYDTTLLSSQIMSGQRLPAPPNPYVAPAPPVPPRTQRFSAGKIVLLMVLMLLIVGGSVFFLITATPFTQTPQAPYTATSFAQTPQDLYTQVTKAAPDLDDQLKSKDTNNWTNTTSADGTFSCEFRGGAYHVSAPYMPCIAQATNFSNLAYEVKMTIVKGDVGGIVFRADGSQKYYSFFIDRHRVYTLRTSVDGTGSKDRVLRTDTSASIKTDLNQANLLTVVAHSSTIDVYINQQFIASASDSIYSVGQIGVFGGYENLDPADVVFSSVRVWKL